MEIAHKTSTLKILDVPTTYMLTNSGKKNNERYSSKDTFMQAIIERWKDIKVKKKQLDE